MHSLLGSDLSNPAYLDRSKQGKYAPRSLDCEHSKEVKRQDNVDSVLKWHKEKLALMAGLKIKGQGAAFDQDRG